MTEIVNSVEKARICFISGFKSKVAQFLINHQRMDSWPFCEILQALHEHARDKGFRNSAYRWLSKGYNGALEAGEFEGSVICLMLMRLILKHEESENDARLIAVIASDIIRTVMLNGKKK